MAQLVAAVSDGRSVVRLVEGDFFTEAGHVDVLRRLLEGKRIRKFSKVNPQSFVTIIETLSKNDIFLIFLYSNFT